MIGRTSPRTLGHAWPGFALGLCLLASSGCSAARWLADELAEDPTPRTESEGSGAGTTAPLPPPVTAADLANAAIGRESRTGATASTYVVSPALTWGELQFHRPYAVTGAFYHSHHQTPACTAESRAPYELTGQRNTLFAEQIVGAKHVPFGIRSTYVPVGSVFGLDREVASDRAMRTGAYLVQRGPVCFGTFLDVTFFGAIGGDLSSTGQSSW